MIKFYMWKVKVQEEEGQITYWVGTAARSPMAAMEGAMQAAGISKEEDAGFDRISNVSLVVSGLGSPIMLNVVGDQFLLAQN